MKTEFWLFVAFLVPTLIVLAAAVVSLVSPDPAVANPRTAQTTAACGACQGRERQERDSER